jgi:Carbohydrate-selective porin, OprB family/S-layer homology domain
MNKIWKAILLSPILLTAMMAISGVALAEEISGIKPEKTSAIKNKLEKESKKGSMAQVTSVSQLSDVQPTDWAFQALQSLVERYGCIAGYPDGTFRGNRALTRYEFAAGLNACLQRISELIETSTNGLTKKEDLEVIKKLQDEFSAELATLRGRVDAIEAKTSQIEANQFSTTSKLQGQLVTAVTDVLSGDKNNNNATFGAKARIEFVTSFTGKDQLLTRIQANNSLNPDLGTNEGGFSFTGENGNTNASIDALKYSFPLGKKTTVVAIANAGAADDVTNTVNIFDGDGAAGSLTKFGTRNPIYFQAEGSGLGITHEFGDSLALSLAYLAETPNNPQQKSSLFDGPSAALAQLTIKPSDRLTLGLTYINSYNRDIGVGGNAASPGSFIAGLDLDGNGDADETVPFSSNSYGAQLSWQLSNNFVLGGWAGYTQARNQTTFGGLLTRGDVDVWNYAITLGFPDLGKKGNLGGIIVGVEPRVTNSTVRFDGTNLLAVPKSQDTSYHIEAFYQYQVNDNITITPGVIWLTAPDHNSNNDSTVIGAIRTTFSF